MNDGLLVGDVNGQCGILLVDLTDVAYYLDKMTLACRQDVMALACRPDVENVFHRAGLAGVHVIACQLADYGTLGSCLGVSADYQGNSSNETRGDHFHPTVDNVYLVDDSHEAVDFRPVDFHYEGYVS